MKLAMKKLLAAVAIIAVATTSSIGVFAEYDPNKVVDPNAVSTKMTKPVFAVSVNGNLLETADIYVSEKDEVMIPIRAVAEALGFTVGWDSGRVTLTKSPVYVTFAIGEDSYTFAKTAPMQIGQAPELVNELTYVPDTFFSTILEADITVAQNGEITINYGEATEEKQEGKAVVKSVTEDEEYDYTAVLVEDEKLGEVQLNLGEESEIVLADGTKGTPAEIKEGMNLDIEYGEAMTMSIPPQNNPVKVTVLGEDEEQPAEEEKVAGNAVISQIEENKVTVADDKLGEVVLNIGEDTKIVLLDGTEGTLSDLAADMDVVVEYGAAMTASLPPQNTPVSITVVEREAAEEELTEEGIAIKGEIVEVADADEQGNLACTIKAEVTEDNTFEEIVLIVSDETAITKDGEEAAKEDLKAGVKMEAVHSQAMTFSIPPQTSAISINIIG